MKSVTDINRQIVLLQHAIAELNAMGNIVQSAMLAGSKPVIRITKNDHCTWMIEHGKASYSHVINGSGNFRQGFFELHGCRVTWSESLH